MLSSVITQDLISLLTLICFLHCHVKAENEHHHSLKSSASHATTEIAEEAISQDSNWDCVRFKAFKDVEKIFNATDDSAEAKVKREKYRSRIKRCAEKETQDRIMREFEAEKSATQKTRNQNTNEDVPSTRNLYQTSPLHTDSTEPDSRKYRTLPVNLKSFAENLSNASVSRNTKSTSTEPSSSTYYVKKSPEMFKKQGQRTVASSSQPDDFTGEPETGESLSLSATSHAIPPIEGKQRKTDNAESRSTKVTKNDGKRKKAPLRNLSSRIREVTEGGASKHSVDVVDKTDLDEQIPSTDPAVEGNVAYGKVMAYKNIDHSAKSRGEISSNGRPHGQRENSIVQTIGEYSKKQPQSEIEEFEKLSEKMAGIIHRSQSTKNRTKISSPTFDDTAAKRETTADENVKRDTNFRRKSDDIITPNYEKNRKNTQNFAQKATALEIPSKDAQARYVEGKHTIASSPAPIRSFKRQAKVTSGSPHAQRNDLRNLRITALSPAEIHPSKHHRTNHKQHTKTHLQNANLSQNHSQKDPTPSVARSDGDEQSHYHPPRIIQNARWSTASSEERAYSSKLDSTPSTINILLHVRTERFQKPVQRFGSSSEGSAIAQNSRSMKNEPGMLFRRSSTKLPPSGSSLALRPGPFSEKSTVSEYPHSGRRSTARSDEPKLSTTQRVDVTEERTTPSEHSIYNKAALTHFRSNPIKNSKSAPISPQSEPSEKDGSLYHIYHPTTIPKSTNRMLLEKSTQITPFYKIKELKKIIPPGKRRFLDEMSLFRQPIQSPKVIPPGNITTEKSRLNGDVLPLVHRHSPRTNSSRNTVHSPKFKPNENFTSHPPVEVTLSTKSREEKHPPLHQPNQLEMPSNKQTLEKTRKEKSSHSRAKLETSEERFTSPTTDWTDVALHSRSRRKHMREISTPHPPSHPVEERTNRPHSDRRAISLYSEKASSTVLSPYATEIHSAEVNLPQNSREIPHVTRLPRPIILREIKKLEKQKTDEIKSLQKYRTKPRTHSVTKLLHPAHFGTTPATLPYDEMVVDMPLPPLNPNDNWRYLIKLDEWYEKQKAKPSTIPIISNRCQTVYFSTIAPTPISPARSAPNDKRPRPNSTVTSTSTRKPPPPDNACINSTINRSCNIATSTTASDCVPCEDDEGTKDESIDAAQSSNLPSVSSSGCGNGSDPSVNTVRSACSPKIANELTADWDGLPYPSFSRESPLRFTQLLSDSQFKNETTPLPSSSVVTSSSSSEESISILQEKSSPQDNSSSSTSDSAERDNKITRTSIRSDSKRRKHLATATSLREKMVAKLENPPSKAQTDSATAAPTGKTDLATVSDALSAVGNCTPACNNYIIVIPDKTEEIIQIQRENDRTPLAEHRVVPPAPRSAQNEHTSTSSISSDIKSLLELIIKAKTTPSNNAELRKSINEITTSLKQRRINEYAESYQYRLNPTAGEEGRDNIVAITQINECIELLELMMVYLARDPDKLLDEKNDARIDNFESPYAEDDRQRRLIEDQFHYVHPKILNEFIDSYKKYSKGERYFGGPAWQFSQENDQRAGSRPRTSGGFFSNLFNFKGLVQPLIYNRAPVYASDTHNYDY